MSSNIKKEVILEGLNCAHCASKIEHEVTGLENVTFAHLDFISKKLTIDIKNDDHANHTMHGVTKIVHKLEPDVKIIDKDADKKEKLERLETSNEKKQELYRIGIGAFLFALALIFNFSPNIELALYLIAYVLVGIEVLIKSAKNIKRGQVFDENFLMTIATIGAFAIKEYPEAVAVMLFYQIGEFFQGLAVNRSRKSIADLMDIKPEFANFKTKHGVTKVSPEKVKIGDIIIVKPGEKVPLDGIVTKGTSMVETSALTGESVPKRISEGQEILSGFININGLLTISVTKEFKDSTVSKILDLVQNASSRKSQTENFITKFARYYTPTVVIIAALLAILPPLLLTGANFSDWLYRALVFLVISCPCALVVSIPLGFFGGIGTASKHGILIKGSNYLEALNNVEVIVFDKTGTLTKGVFKVTEVNPANDFTKDEILEYAALAESYSNHPIAESIQKAYQKEIKKIQLPIIVKFLVTD
ncbi:heavy metal-(Cd/Co/Hg/Pb/Zn)-translocating P-type ATPase [Desulfonispora thiosulfatigenes DSM 11270]|uniref:Cd(2+)-exporting ATPase n=1 Tax=Desulfonispora thiosulfatigenes DSM 11270 TaxID=656914 RepID=A0A1W1UZ90_DESTI|nr:heavy metal-(Cd/Co/Hg/Pb/Zn)-translocating P-type ATPase [Desulfonispora thiosulfatigenes DSM 11270]